MQNHVIWSETIKGAGLYAGGPYGVGSTRLDDSGMDVPTAAAYKKRNLERMLAKAEELQGKELIDKVSNLKGQPVYIWGGTEDSVVQSVNFGLQRAMYERWGANVGGTTVELDSHDKPDPHLPPV